MKDSKKIKELKHQSRRTSIKEGIFATAKTSFGDHYVSPFAIAVNASNSAVVMLNSLAGILGPLSQTFSVKLIEKYPRKKIVVRAVFLESFIWIFFALLGYLFYKDIITSIIPFLVLLFFSVYVIISNFSTPVWFSWMGDLVDEEYRGRWFAKRNFITGVVSLFLTLSAAVFLDYLKKNNLIISGFIILFSLAFIGRLLSWKTFKDQYEPKLKLKKRDYFSFYDFLLRAPKTNFGRFSIFKASLNFACAIASPLVAIYLLRVLELNYLPYILITFASGFFTLILINLFGKFADIYGDYKTIFLSSLLIPLVPLAWMISPSVIYLILVPGIISGLAWGAFDLASNNFIYDNVSPEKRCVAVSYHNLLNGIGISLGAGLGAILLQLMNFNLIKEIYILFITSAVLRLIIIAVSLPKIKETRKIKKIKKNSLRKIIIKEIKPAIVEEAHELTSIRRYILE